MRMIVLSICQEEARLKRKRTQLSLNPPVNRSTNRNNVDINSSIDTQMLDQLIAKRVAEALAAAAIEGDRVKFASSILLDGVLTWWNVMPIGIDIKPNGKTSCGTLKVKGTNLTAYNQLDLHEAIEMAQGLMYQVVQELGENSGDKKKWNGNHYNHNNTNHASNLNPNKRPKAARVSYCWQGHKVKDCRAPPRLTSQIGPGNQEDREVMSLVLDVARRDITRTSVQTMEIKAEETKFEATRKVLRTIRGRIKGTL
ncbi:hypothetical protein Tco_1093237 [Tanacetum coccineum]|uniref:Reverse transcriptase domain-containing protein n=1 Tax=Tanacetum coccineum TaxID=301880 RepID=A0ABQ5IC45_9ASTR